MVHRGGTRAWEEAQSREYTVGWRERGDYFLLIAQFVGGTVY
jgi:hypothetical protein